MKLVPTLAAAAIVATAAVAAAAPVTLVNPGFEQPNPGVFISNADGSAARDAIPGFVATLESNEANFAFVGNAFDQETPDPDDGNGFAFLLNSSIATAASARPAATPDFNYTLTFDARNEVAGAGGGLSASISFFNAAGELISSSSENFLVDPTTTAYQANLTLGPVASPANTASVGVSFTTLQFESSFGRRTINVDNLRLDASPIPEPGTAAGAAVLGLIALRRRRGAN